MQENHRDGVVMGSVRELLQGVRVLGAPNWCAWEGTDKQRIMFGSKEYKKRREEKFFWRGGCPRKGEEGREPGRIKG